MRPPARSWRPTARSPNDGARHLLAPILEEGFDLVCPCYATHRFEGVLTTGIVYPLTRSVFGQRLRQPIGDELAVSRSLASHLLGEAWHGDAAHAGDRLWLVTAALSRDFRVCQSQLGSRLRHAPGGRRRPGGLPGARGRAPLPRDAACTRRSGSASRVLGW